LGQTFTLSHLAPFVERSREKIKKRMTNELTKLNISIPKEKFNELIEMEVKKEIEAGCQTIQYQLITLQSTNGSVIARPF